MDLEEKLEIFRFLRRGVSLAKTDRQKKEINNYKRKGEIRKNNGKRNKEKIKE